MKITLILFAASFIGFIVLDYLWLGILMKNFYVSELASVGRIQDGKFNPILWSAMVVYIFLPLGILFFCLPIATNLPHALWVGGLFGLVVYGVYEFTNYALLKNWGLPVVFLDLVWGAILCGANSGLVYFIRGWLKS